MTLTPKQRTLLAEQCKHLPAKMPLGTFAIYTLADPSTDSVHYVGMTQFPRRRLASHVKRLTTKSEKRRWILDLSARGQIPIMSIMESFVGTPEEALGREREWIERLLKEGVLLANREAGWRRAAATGGVSMPTQQLIGREDVVVDTIDQMTLTLYGRSVIAVRLADGRTGVMLHGLCVSLEIDQDGLLRRIRRKVPFADGLFIARIETSGGLQSMLGVTLPTLMWVLFTIDERMLPERQQKDVIAFQQGCARILAVGLGDRQNLLWRNPVQ